MKTKNFTPFALSNKVTTPPSKTSEKKDVTWVEPANNSKGLKEIPLQSEKCKRLMGSDPFEETEGKPANPSSK